MRGNRALITIRQNEGGFLARHTTITGINYISRARLVMSSSSRPIWLLLARRTLGADGKDYRADFVHAPFPKISAPDRP